MMMEEVLIIAAKGADLLKELLSGHARTAVAGNGAAARRLLLQRCFSLVIINSPLPDESGMELAVETAGRPGTGVILLVRAEYVEEVAVSAARYGIFVMEKPLHRPYFLRTLALVRAYGQRLLELLEEKRRLENKLEEMRLVSRAKCALIQYLDMTEAEAHRYIEKKAMDSQAPRRDIAVNIIKTYEK